MVDELTCFEEEQASISCRLNTKSEKTKTDTKITIDFQKALKASRKIYADPTYKVTDKARKKVQKDQALIAVFQTS